MSPIGVDEWVAQSGQRRDRRSGWRGALARVDERVGWWPRLAIVALVGVGFGQLGPNSGQANVVLTGLIYAILALGLNVVVGWAGLLDLGYVAFFGFGAYGYALLSSTAFGSAGLGGVHLAAVESFPIVFVATGIFGLVIGLVALRLSGDYLAIVTLFVGQAFMEFVNDVATHTLGGVNGIFGLDPLHSFGGRVGSVLGYYYVALIFVILLMAALRLLDTSRTGRAWRAVRDDPLAAQVMTVPVRTVKVMAFSFGAAIAGIAGAIFAAQQQSVFPTNFTENILILIYACLVLGGVGSIWGAVLGGIIVWATENMLSSPTDAGYLFYGLILLALLTRVRPWKHLAAVLVAIVGLGLATHAIVGAISHSAVDGPTGTVGWIGRLFRHYVIVPGNPTTYGNVLFVALVCLLVALVRLHGVQRLIAVVPTVYIAACCWESRLVVDSAITTQIMLGAVLIVMMAARPEGLLGTRRVEVV